MVLILGSQSPRRREILSFFSLPFFCTSPVFDEDSVIFSGQPEDYVCALSKGKADSLISSYPHSIILTADTTVCRNGKIYNKPKDEDEAFSALNELAGQWHSVYTGVTLRLGEKEFHQAEETRVLFNSMTPEQIRHYHSKIHWADKAGGYAIQMSGGLIVRKIEGCYYNVLGLPINTVRELLKKVGIELWDYVK
jgi:septum formation protein